ncbi:hypothetical protein L6452_21427 [Arctium lappa]|uniref:Uncharacterized protein n=1 Tax=Arctium lappa TaxID=4217 RepID=A0ACB9AXP0_ARCLA|nr:hypothetical protein L6452_21427 [Arctium lappa]
MGDRQWKEVGRRNKRFVSDRRGWSVQREVCGWIPGFIEEDSLSEEEEGEGSPHVEVHPSYGVGINDNEDLSEKILDSFENEEFTFHDNVEEINKDEVEEERDTNDPFEIIRLLEKQPVQNIGLEKVGESDAPFYPPGFTPLSDGANGEIKVDMCPENQLKESPLTDDSIGVDFSHQETKAKSNIPIAEKFTSVSRATRPVLFEGEVNSNFFASCEQLLW